MGVDAVGVSGGGNIGDAVGAGGGVELPVGVEIGVAVVSLGGGGGYRGRPRR